MANRRVSLWSGRLAIEPGLWDDILVYGAASFMQSGRW